MPVFRSFHAAFALAAGLVVARAAGADEVPVPSGWTLDSRPPGVAVFYREDDRARGRAYRGVGEVDAPPDVVFAVVTNVEAHPTFMPYIVESTIVQRLSPNETIIHQVISPPVIGARDAFFHIVATPGSSPADVWRSTWTAAPDFAPERPGYVRLHVAEGSWLFEPEDGGTHTRVTYTSLASVGGAVPVWVANTQSSSVIRKMYDAIRARVRERLAAHPPAPSK